MDSVSRFTETVQNYVKYRPNYPPELFHFLLEQYSAGSNNGDRTICDLGAGTGIFTRQLGEFQIGTKIFAIEPNDSMREAAISDEAKNPTPIIEYLKGTAESTGLPSRSVDGVLGAQCFHWFDLEKTIKEIDRIAKPGSFCAAIWNDRVSTGFNEDLERILRRESSSYPKLKRPNDTIQELKQRIPRGQEKQIEYNQPLTLEGLQGRMASTSYVTHGVVNKKAFNEMLAVAFKKHQKNGLIDMVYKTRVFWWRTPTSPGAKL
jgi:SAM-dependent methyltransferase